MTTQRLIHSFYALIARFLAGSFVVAMLFLLSLPSNALAEIKIFAMEIPALYGSAASGAYSQVIKEAIGDSEKFSIFVAPPAFCRANFRRCTSCCIAPVGTLAHFKNKDGLVLLNPPMNYAKVYIFTAAGEPPIKTLEDLQGKKLGLRRGFSYGRKTSAKLEKLDIPVEYVNTLESNILKLQAKRVDAILAFVPDILTYFSRHNIPPLSYAPDSPLGVYREGIVCRGVSKAFVKHYEKQLTKMRKSGRLKEILGDLYVEE